MHATVTESAIANATPIRERGERFLLWIDGVGAFLICLADNVTYGGPAANGNGADVSLLANLSRRHVTFSRSGERYILHAHSPAFVNGRPVHDRIDLTDGAEIHLGNNVRLRLRVPTVMSGTARLEFLSDHRPPHTCDGVILMDQTCLLGATADNHVCCPGWPESVLLYRRGDQLCCKSRGELFLNGQHAPTGGTLENGTIVTSAEIRFRLETLG